ncbi:MAG: hypothetical protein JWO36_675 [Myxococcales bacterium]|nr:hypothetical protein [Myxococcales bacterium]
MRYVVERKSWSLRYHQVSAINETGESAMFVRVRKTAEPQDTILFRDETQAQPIVRVLSRTVTFDHLQYEVFACDTGQSLGIFAKAFGTPGRVMSSGFDELGQFDDREIRIGDRIAATMTRDLIEILPAKVDPRFLLALALLRPFRQMWVSTTRTNGWRRRWA